MLRIHYRNPDLVASYARLFMWTWGAWDPERDVPTCGEDDFGAIFEVPRELFAADAMMGFKFKQGAGSGGPWYEMDRGWTEGEDCWEVWVVQGDSSVYCSPEEATLPRIVAAWWDTDTAVDVHFSADLPRLDSPDAFQLDNEAQVLGVTVEGPRHVVLETTALDVRRCYTLTVQTEQGPIDNALYPRGALDRYDTALPLGSGIDGEGNTWFRVFAPRAQSVTLLTSPQPRDDDGLAHGTTYEPADGTWTATLPGNLHGTYYWYQVDGPRCRGEKFDPGVPLNDPYAFIALSSWGGTAGRSMVFDLAQLEPPAPFERPPFQDMVAWEVHVRDLTGAPNSGMDPRHEAYRRYAGFAVEGLRGPQVDGEAVLTGLDHILELGVNTVQLLPTQEFPADPGAFNWGYFTANFFSPEGMYASSDEGPAKAHEFKAMVDALHARGIAVVVDIVFNHSAEGTDLGPYINFKGFDSKYYYRQDPFSYSYSNGSGVGNELATERPMVRRFLIDCMAHWVERYGVDGFRFDLAGLVDRQTMAAIGERFPDLYLYGEPWASSGALWGKGQVNDLEPWAVFNDDFRNDVKGDTEGAGRGFIQAGGSRARTMAAVTGNSVPVPGRAAHWADSHMDSVLYLDAHDNLTLADKLEISMPGITPEDKEARVKLAAALTLTSLGPIMLHAGVEFLRSKPYVEGVGDGRPVRDPDGDLIYDANSYSSPDATNNLDWQLKAEHFGLFQFVRGMLALRLGELGQGCRPAQAVAESYFEWLQPEDNATALGYLINADGTGGDRRLLVLLNPDAEQPATFSASFPQDEGWFLVADSHQVQLEGIEPIEGDEDLLVEPLGIRIYADGF